MHDMPKWLNSAQDYINIVAECQAGRVPVDAVRTALQRLAASAEEAVNVADYPPDYGIPSYDGKPIVPIWEQRPAPNGTLSQLGMTVEEVDALLAEVPDDK